MVFVFCGAMRQDLDLDNPVRLGGHVYMPSGKGANFSHPFFPISSFSGTLVGFPALKERWSPFFVKIPFFFFLFSFPLFVHSELTSGWSSQERGVTDR